VVLDPKLFKPYGVQVNQSKNMKDMSQILNGKFSSGIDAITKKAKQGNFTGYSEDGTQIFISKQLMESIGIKTEADLKNADGSFKSFFTIFDAREIPQADKDGEMTLTAQRVQALSVFLTEESMVNAFYASERRKIVGQGGLKTLATTVGLSDATVNAILSASI
jgi:hypothetical protein